MSIPPPLRKLQYVLAVARELHFRRAAERLNVSQPYISRQIKEFEADIGFNIFRRDPVCLTASGQELVVRIGEMLSRLDADFRIAVDAARAVNQRQAKEFTIGHCACTSPQFRRQIRVVQKVRFPKLRMRFRILSVLDMFDALETGQIQVGITFAPLGRDDLRQIPLRSERLCAILPRRNPLSVESSLSLADLSKRALVTADFRRTHPTLHQWLNEQCLATGFRPAFVEEVTSTQEATDLVQEGVGIALLPEGVCRNETQDVCVIPIRDLKPLELVLVYRSNCSPIAEKIAIGIADSIRSDELARTG
jgi:DNA-binding transcriptional LysR family regulator